MAEQQVLAGVGPPRSLLAGLRAPVWGLDPSTLRISLGALAAGVEPIAVTRSLRTGPTRGARLAFALPELIGWFVEMAHALGRPSHIALEQPFGRTIPVISLEVQGMLQIALWEAFGRDVIVSLVNPPKWKLAAMGRGFGNAKPAVYTQWAEQACGWCPGPTHPEDEAAALGIATWQAAQIVTSG